MRVLFYTTASGRNPVEDVIRWLPARLQAAILVALERIEEGGLTAPGVSFRQIRDKLWEISPAPRVPQEDPEGTNT